MYPTFTFELHINLFFSWGHPMGSLPTMTDELQGHDQEQIALMEERLILLDQDDNAIGEESKKTCKSSHPFLIWFQLK
jgi:hypothetical protein